MIPNVCTFVLCLTMYSWWAIVVQRAKREMILAGKRFWDSVETGMMLCSENGSTKNQTQICHRSLAIFQVQNCFQITYLKRQTVCVKPSETGLGPSAVSWCSPCGWHWENYLHVHPETTTHNVIQLQHKKMQGWKYSICFLTHTCETSLGKFSPPRYWTHM